jgi:hypothetical protein
MRIKILFATVLALSLMLATALAGNITGTWKGTMDMMGQSMELGFKFKADGSKLGGTAIGPQGEETPITEGKIDGDKISFTVKVTGQMEMTIKYKGTIAADAIKLTMSMDMGGGMGGPGGGGPGGGMGGPGGGGPGGGGPGGGMPPMEITLKKVE